MNVGAGGEEVAGVGVGAGGETGEADGAVEDGSLEAVDVEEEGCGTGLEEDAVVRGAEGAGEGMEVGEGEEFTGM